MDQIWIERLLEWPGTRSHVKEEAGLQTPKPKWKESHKTWKISWQKEQTDFLLSIEFQWILMKKLQIGILVNTVLYKADPRP